MMSEAARQYWLIAYEADRALDVEDFVEGSDVGAVDSIAYRIGSAERSGVAGALAGGAGALADERAAGVAGALAEGGGGPGGRTPVWLSLVFLTKRKRCAQMAGLLVAEVGRLWIEDSKNCDKNQSDLSSMQSALSFSIRAEEIVDCLPIRGHIMRSGGELHLVAPSLKRKGEDTMDEEEIELRRRERVADLKLRVLMKEKQVQEEAAMREQRAKEEARKKLDEVSGCMERVVGARIERICARIDDLPSTGMHAGAASEAVPSVGHVAVFRGGAAVVSHGVSGGFLPASLGVIFRLAVPMEFRVFFAQPDQALRGIPGLPPQVRHQRSARLGADRRSAPAEVQVQLLGGLSESAA